jgi:Zn-dependent protease with chaperone function
LIRIAAPRTVPGVESAAHTERPPSDTYRKAIEYARARYRLYFASTAYGLAVLASVIAVDLGPVLRDVAARAATSAWLQAAVYAPILLTVLAIADLPTAAWGHRLALRYGQSIQSWTSWLWDWTRSELLTIAIATFLVAVLYAVIRASPNRWWLVFWLLSQPILVFLLFLQPLVIAPLFFEFRPLREAAPDLVCDMERIVERARVEIASDRMFEMKASKKLKSVNAYVAGIGASKRVVVWDTTIANMTKPQTLFIFGHELGHYVLGHIPRTLAVASAGLLLVSFVGQLLLEWAIPRYGGAWSIPAVSDLASLPVILFGLSAVGFLATPLFSAYSRSLEHAADVYGLEITQGVLENPGATAADAFRRLAEIDLADPAPPRFIRFWLYGHPPIGERIAFAERFRQGG